MPDTGGPRWLVNTAAKLGRGLAQMLAMPADLHGDSCHVHIVYAAIMEVPGHGSVVHGAMQELFDWHNLRANDGEFGSATYLTEAYCRCMAIYGAAAMAVLEADAKEVGSRC